MPQPSTYTDNLITITDKDIAFCIGFTAEYGARVEEIMRSRGLMDDG